MTKSELLQNLHSSKQQTLKYFELSEEYLSKSYGSGKWNIIQLLHHIADAETVLYDRIRRGLSKPKQVVWGFDQDAWCEGLSYMSMPLAINKPIFSSVRDAIIRLIELHYDSAHNYQYVHSETGIRSVRDEMEKVDWHCRHHLQQIAQALTH